MLVREARAVRDCLVNPFEGRKQQLLLLQWAEVEAVVLSAVLSPSFALRKQLPPHLWAVVEAVQKLVESEGQQALPAVARAALLCQRLSNAAFLASLLQGPHTPCTWTPLLA